MVKALVDAVTDGAVVKQEANTSLTAIMTPFTPRIFSRPAGQRRRIGQILPSLKNAATGRSVVAFANPGIRITDRLVQRGLERSLNHPSTNLFAGLGQRDYIFNVQRSKRVDLLGQVVVLKEFTEGFSGSSKTAQNETPAADRLLIISPRDAFLPPTCSTSSLPRS